MENAQFNTMLCKGTMNFLDERKKGGKPLARVPATLPGFFGGGHRAKPIQDTTIAAEVKKKITK
jgi:hypothetical protein